LYSICKLKFWNIASLLKVSDILYECGKDMAKKFDLHHWDNSRLKSLVIVLWCMLKNNIYLVYNHKIPVATFQTRKVNHSYLFEKLATLPDFAGDGVGTFCLNKIELLGKNEGCQEIICAVLENSEHAKRFYERRGFAVYGTTRTLKYTELKLKKKLEG